ncbi:MAG TPA: hypothetical protein VL588_12230 [Bdellovibrionota bacterium]|jgi:chromosome segregation ATPase|nr:hypothetical protein [Bdellovibrionota bacterium]
MKEWEADTDAYAVEPVRPAHSGVPAQPGGAWNALAAMDAMNDAMMPPMPLPAGGSAGLGAVRNQMESILFTADRLERALAEEKFKNHRLATRIAQIAREYDIKASEQGEKRENLLRENADLKASIEAHKVRNEDLAAQLRSVDEELRKLKPLASSYPKAAKAANELQEKCNRVERELKKVSGDQDDMSRRLVELQSENQGLNEKLNRETHRRLAAEDSLRDIRDSAQSLMRMHEEFRSTTGRITHEVQVLRDRVEKLGEMGAEAAHEARTAVQVSEAVRFQVERYLTEIRGQVDRVAVQIAEVRPALAQVQTSSAESRERAVAFEAGLREKVEGQLKAVKEGYEILARQLDEGERRVREHHERLDAADDALRTLKPFVARADGSREETAKTLSDLQKDLHERYDRLNSLISLKAQSFETRMGSLYASKEPTQDTLKRLISDVAELRAENAALKARLDQSETK